MVPTYAKPILRLMDVFVPLKTVGVSKTRSRNALFPELKPETERLVREEIRRGHCHSVDEVIVKGT